MDIRAHERMVGFDARKIGLNFRSWWSPSRQAEFSLNPDSPQVFSIDSMVWPSIFKHGLVGRMPLTPEEEKAMGGPKEPEGWRGMNLPCWSDLSQLRDFISEHASEIALPCALIAVTCADAAHDWESCFPYADELRPGTINPGWKFLGFDIADDSMISGMTNCGYDDEDFTEISRESWAARLNEYHLFSAPADAEAFREFSDRRVTEHAPFRIYGLYLIEELGGEPTGKSGN